MWIKTDTSESDFILILNGLRFFPKLEQTSKVEATLYLDNSFTSL